MTTRPPAGSPNGPQLALFPAPLPQAPLNDAQRIACLRLIRSENVGPVTFRELINHFGGAEQALAALPEVARKAGRRASIKICPYDVAEAELAAAEKIGGQPLFTIEPGYPPLLAHVDVPPPLLYVKGDISLLSRRAVAIVGSRDASAAGQKLTRLFAAQLGEAGYVVVSGLARGIDGVAHTAAMATGTIAVVAGGLDIIYPPEHKDLHAELGRTGCIVSEMPPGFTPRGQDFPRRNRIISGMSYGVVVVEAAKRSGTLITARMAGEQGREVFAVPGHPLDPRAEGTNQLLRSGATLVTSAADIIEALEPVVTRRIPLLPMGDGGGLEDGSAARLLGDARPAERVPQRSAASLLMSTDVDNERVFNALGPAPVNMDELARATALPIRAVQVAVLELALAGRVERHGAHLVSRIDPDAT
jgi:DNA processing protein